jgi:hypothetical protein
MGYGSGLSGPSGPAVSSTCNWAGLETFGRGYGHWSLIVSNNIVTSREEKLWWWNGWRHTWSSLVVKPEESLLYIYIPSLYAGPKLKLEVDLALGAQDPSQAGAPDAAQGGAQNSSQAGAQEAAQGGTQDPTQGGAQDAAQSGAQNAQNVAQGGAQGAAQNGTAAAGGAAAGGAAAGGGAAGGAAAGGAAAGLDFGSCPNPGIVFGPGFDGRQENSFLPADMTQFMHGSAQSKFSCTSTLFYCLDRFPVLTSCYTLFDWADHGDKMDRNRHHQRLHV